MNMNIEVGGPAYNDSQMDPIKSKQAIIISGGGGGKSFRVVKEI